MGKTDSINENQLLHSKISTLEELLKEYEQTVINQTTHLKEQAAELEKAYKNLKNTQS